MNKSFWEYEVADVIANYPDARWRDVCIAADKRRIWRLTMNPIPAQHELGAVLNDLDRGLEVWIGGAGQVSHSPGECGMSLDRHPATLPDLQLTPRPYTVELMYPSTSLAAAGSVHPKAKVIDPEISHRTYSSHPHMYYAGGESYACPLSPQDTKWRWRKGATRQYLDQVALWLLKTAVWIATSIAGIFPPGRWLGPDTSHEPLYLLGSIDIGSPCWCGSGRSYGACHRPSDYDQAQNRLTRYL